LDGGELSHFEYITIAIIFGYAVSELLAGIGRLIRQRDQVDFYWVHSGLVIALMVALMNAWWNIWGDVPDSVDLLTV
jgi:hypothetical protein